MEEKMQPKINEKINQSSEENIKTQKKILNICKFIKNYRILDLTNGIIIHLQFQIGKNVNIRHFSILLQHNIKVKRIYFGKTNDVN